MFRRLIESAALIALALIACGCNDRPAAPSNINITNNNSNQNGSGSGDGTVNPADCPQAVRINVAHPDTVHVGEDQTLDATYKTATGQRSDACNIQEGITWTSFSTDICTLGDAADFTPRLITKKPGLCTVQATSPKTGLSSGPVSITVVP